MAELQIAKNENAFSLHLRLGVWSYHETHWNGFNSD